MGDISISDLSPPTSHQEQISEWGVANQKVVTETLQMKLVVLQTYQDTVRSGEGAEGQHSTSLDWAQSKPPLTREAPFFSDAVAPPCGNACTQASNMNTF